MSNRETGRRGLGNAGFMGVAPALTLALLILAGTTACIISIAASHTRIIARHSESGALFLADAGLEKAGHRLATDLNYRGEKGTRMPTGYFDVSVTPSGRGYVVRSTGYADSALARKPRLRVQADVRVLGHGRFRISEWRQNP